MNRFRFSTVAALLLTLVLAVSASAAPWKFGVMSDTQWPTSPDQKNPNGTAINVARHLSPEFIKQGVKFVIQVGDLTDKGSSNNLELDTRATFAQDLYNAGIGFFPLRGNHESSKSGALETQRIFPQTGAVTTNAGVNNQTPANAMISNTIYGPQANTNGTFTVGSNFVNRPGYEGLTYSFDYDNARFVLIDTWTSPAGTSKTYMNQADIDWVGGRFAAKPANTHAFSFAHKHLISENHNDNLFASTPDASSATTWPLTDSFMSYLATNGVRYHIGGHDHMHNRAIVTSPDGASKVQNIITASDSYKFYVPGSQGAWASRENMLSQELFTVGYYIFTVDGPKVTVDYYASPNGCNGDCDQTTDVIPYTFTKHETFGYSLNGKELLVPQGASYVLTDTTAKAVTNGETGYIGTTASILSGTNGSTGKDYRNRALTKSVNTGWVPKNGETASDIFTLGGMADSLATNFTDTNNTNYNYKYVVPNTTTTDTFALSITYDPTKVSSAQLQSGLFGLATRDENGKWVNAVTKNTGGVRQFVNGPWNASYSLGAYGIDTATHTAWAVINHQSDFAVANFPWTFGVMDDTQWTTTDPAGTNPNGVPVTIINQINQQFINKGVKLVVQVGDLTENGNDADEIVRANAAQTLLDHGIGFFPMRGNHETYASPANDYAIPRLKLLYPQTRGLANTFGAANFNSPTSVSTDLDGMSYSFDYNNARFVVLDTWATPSKVDNNADGYAYGYTVNDQQPWISSRLDKSSRGTDHAFVLAHQPLIAENHQDTMFSGYTNANPAWQNAFFASLFNNDVKYFMSGHDHIHQRSIIASPDGLSTVQEIIGASNSSKFYTPKPLNNAGWYGQKSRETSLSQETYTVGYYVYSVDGPRVTVDYYSDDHGNWASDNCFPSGATPQSCSVAGNHLTPTYNFVKKESWGYSLNGKEFLVAQGQPYTTVQDSFSGTTAKILSGTNNSTKRDASLDVPSGVGRKLTKSVDTGWTAKFGALSSDILTLWGMTDLGATSTDTFVLSISYDPTGITPSQIQSGSFGLASRGAEGRWVNAVEMNNGGALKYVQRAWQAGDTLGTYGVDSATNTVWAVINHASDFAATSVADMSSRVKVVSSGFLYSRATKTYNGTLTMTNTGNVTIAGPFSITLNNLTSGITLNNAGGSSNGYPQVSVPVAALNAGQSVSVPVSFTNPANALIKYAPVVAFQAL
jgi:hypothetical protein